MSRSLILAAVLGIVAAIPAYGQTVILIEPSAVQAEASPYSEAELQQFAVTAVTLQRINDDVIPRLESASSREEQEELVQAASVEMMQAVQRKGMSVDRFQEIMQEAQANPELGQRVVQLIESLDR